MRNTRTEFSALQPKRTFLLKLKKEKPTYNQMAKAAEKQCLSFIENHSLEVFLADLRLHEEFLMGHIKFSPTQIKTVKEMGGYKTICFSPC